ncbi:MAG: twin-arginine translocation pathway signal protein, partial [Pseudomonadota bacterium]
MPSRRAFLRILGGGTVVAAAGTGGFLATRTPAHALAPWDAAPGYNDTRKRILAHALLAPNPHNRQPWLVELSGDNAVILHRDKSRELPETDPFNRQIFIGLGCFTELMVIAAGAEGLSTDLTLFPEGEEGPVFRAVFAPGGNPDPLAAHMLTRRSQKEPYEDRLPEPEKVAALEPLARVITDTDLVADLRDLTWAAFQREVYTPATLQESVDLMRVGKSEINANPDGIELTSPFLDALRRVGLLTNDILANPDHPSFQGVLDDYRAVCYGTTAFLVVTSTGNTRFDQIKAGRTWLRLNLTTTGLGLGVHPMSQALQEFPEMAEHYAKAHSLLAKPGETVQMLARLGYGPASNPTPRWGLETR